MAVKGLLKSYVMAHWLRKLVLFVVVILCLALVLLSGSQNNLSGFSFSLGLQTTQGVHRNPGSSPRDHRRLLAYGMGTANTDHCHGDAV